MTDPTRITSLLDAMGDPDRHGDALEQLWPLIYEDLRQRAGRAMARERPHHTLQPTALVHEAYLRLMQARPTAWEGRRHFLAIAARVMRQILVDHARQRDAQRRGGAQTRVTFDEPQIEGARQELDIIDVHRALERLSDLDERAAKVAELRLFAGATIAEVADALELSSRTVDNEWSTARMWLSRELKSGP